MEGGMKKLYSFIGLAFLTVVASYAQGTSEQFIRVDYIQVDPGDKQQFLTVEVDILKDLYQHLQEEEEILDWRLYELAFPGGTRSDYSFMAITKAESLGALEEPAAGRISNERLANTQGNSSTDSAAQRTNWVQQVTHSELWSIANSSFPGDYSPSESIYFSMDYMDVGEGSNYDYLMLEDDVAKPIHEERMEEGVMDGWEVFSLVTPGGTEYGYNYATGNYYDSLDNIQYGFTDDVIINAHPGTDIPELFDMIYRTRDLVRTELWKLVAHTD